MSLLGRLLIKKRSSLLLYLKYVIPLHEADRKYVSYHLGSGSRQSEWVDSVLSKVLTAHVSLNTAAQRVKFEPDKSICTSLTTKWVALLPCNLLILPLLLPFVCSWDFFLTQQNKLWLWQLLIWCSLLHCLPPPTPTAQLPHPSGLCLEGGNQNRDKHYAASQDFVSGITPSSQESC